MLYYTLNWYALQHSVLHLKLVKAGWQQQMCYLIDDEMVAEMLSPAIFTTTENRREESIVH